MIWQLGPSAVFISQSAAETKWPELLHALGKSVNGKDYAQEEISSMDFQTKSELIPGDSATVVLYFDYRFNVFMKDIVHSQCKPIVEVTDYCRGKEFASWGAFRVHWFAYIKDAPVYGKALNTETALFYDKIISCSLDIPEHHKQFVMYQLHRPSTSCQFFQTNTCRFNFP